jgi:hypothetical protein
MAVPPRNMAEEAPYAFGGGLDLTSASIAVPGGRCIAAMNYEPVVDGYARVQGHERFDGRLPSEALIYSVPFNTGTVAPTINSTITGNTSGATAYLLAVDLTSGSYVGGNAAGRLIVCEITGGFLNGEAIRFGATNFAHTSSTTSVVAKTDPLYFWKGSAEFRRRNLVADPPGSGPCRGGFVLNGNVYVVRDNAGGTQGVIYKATAAGWVAQSFGRWLKFRLGLVAIAEGATITGNTSGATAHVDRVIVQDGGWGAAIAADQAVGYLVVSGQVGAFQANEVIKVGATNCATNNHGGDSSALTPALPPGGRYDVKVKNFYGAVNRKRAYVVNGVGTAFEYDGGSVLVPIISGTPVDTPTRVFDIANALGLVFPGGSVQISDPGEPCVFNAILGALEIALGDDCTDVIDANDSAVIFFCKEKVQSLTGRGVDTFVLDEVTEEAGADAWTVQRIGRTMYLDRRGLRDLTSTAAFGDFKAGSLSELFDNYLTAKHRAGATPVASLRCKSKTQYRLFYNDGTGFTVYMGRKAPEMLPFSMDTMRPYAVFTGELADGSEGMFACDLSGRVYRMDSGASFDGVQISAFVMTPFNHLGAIGMNKRAHGVRLELTGSPMASIGVTAQFDYGDGEQPLSGDSFVATGGAAHDMVVRGGGGDFITTSGGGSFDPTQWNQFYWASGTGFQGMGEADLAGAGRNISLIFAVRSLDVEPPHTLQAYTLRWSPRGQVKRTAM